jgi:3-hydroxyisobutyrate dehydrogenase
MLKDLKLAQSAAQSVGVATPLGAHAAHLCQLFVSAGHGGFDYSGIIEFMRGRTIPPPAG